MSAEGNWNCRDLVNKHVEQKRDMTFAKLIELIPHYHPSTVRSAVWFHQGEGRMEVQDDGKITMRPHRPSAAYHPCNRTRPRVNLEQVQQAASVPWRVVQTQVADGVITFIEMQGDRTRERSHTINDELLRGLKNQINAYLREAA